MLIGKGRGLLGEHILEVTPAGLVERTAYNETVHRWQALLKVEKTRCYVYIWITDAMVHAVPVRSFADLESATTFQHEIETQRKAA